MEFSDNSVDSEIPEITKIDLMSIEEKWRKKWNELKIFESDIDPSRPKFFITVAYPYPNSPQHIGHARTYALADVHARYMRMRGFNVLFPMGFHYTGSPILGMSRRVESRDIELLETFRKIYGLSDDVINTFVDPIKIAQYFHNEIKVGMKEMGYSIDWRREFTTIDPIYSKLISWQFKKLKKKGLIVQGSHPVGWCPRDHNPVSQHDTMGDVEPDFLEYTLVKFYLDEWVLPVATLRPETVFGVTNLWINPLIDYFKVKVGEETWIVSKESIKKLEFLNYTLVMERQIDASDLLGRHVISSFTKEAKKILPASFVKSDSGTGIVMSVPAHAPYDLQALKDMEKGCMEMGVPNIDVSDIVPLKIIGLSNDLSNIQSYSDAIISKYNISSQRDINLEKATSEVYSLEFYKGVMLENTGNYAGMSVSEAKDKVKQDLLNKGDATLYYELTNKPVYCRCGNECVVKILNDQWFLNYSNEQWKNLVRKCINEMEIIPSDLRLEFLNVVDWLKDRACARKTGLGTALPWDNEWIIESLSDSVIYMVYYLLSRYISNNPTRDESEFLNATTLTDSFFDYVFLGEGIKQMVISECKINENLLDKIRKDFLYYYPVDSRHSGRDLVPNHLSFFIFNHVSIFDEKYWPHQIVVNGSVLMAGKKMSKSLGNIIPLRKAIREYGVDSIRLSMMISAELLQDADFTFDSVKGIRGKLHDIYLHTIQYSNKSNVVKDITQFELEDRWLMSKLQHKIRDVTLSLDKSRVREALHHILYLLDQDLQWYLKRVKSKNRNNHYSIVKEFLDIRTRLLAPFAPFIAEELWMKLDGGTDSIMLSCWPVINTEYIDLYSEESEDLVKNLISDLQNIVRVTKINPRRIIFYISGEWKSKVYTKIIDIIQKSDKPDFGSVMRSLIEDPNTANAKKDPALVRKMIEDILSVSLDVRTRRISAKSFDEAYCINDAKSFILDECGFSETELLIYKEDHKDIYDPKSKAKFARPYKPAIFIE